MAAQAAQIAETPPVLPPANVPLPQAVPAPKKKERPDEVAEAAYMDATRMQCCGFIEISGLSNFDGRSGENIFLRVAMLRLFNCTGGIVFTDAARQEDEDEDGYPAYEPEYAVALKDYILEKNLGTITETPRMYNYNSERYVKMYIWAPVCQAVKDHLRNIRPDLMNYYNGARPL